MLFGFNTVFKTSIVVYISNNFTVIHKIMVIS